MTNKNTDYEKFVRDIMEALLRGQGLQTVAVQHNVQVAGTSRTHQVDVYWEYRLGGVLHRVIINCKRYNSTVAVTDVLTLSGVLHDMPGVRGLIVTTIGFQKGAVEYAKTHQIGLKVVRPPKDDDWEGRLREVHLDLQIREPELIGCDVQLDREWLLANMTGEPDSFTGGVTVAAATTVVRDLETGTIADMNALWHRALAENPPDAEGNGRGVLQWTAAHLEQPGKPALRLKSMTFRWKVSGPHAERLVMRSDPDAIVHDAINETLLFVDADGTITGDIAEELGDAPARRSTPS